MGGNHAQMVSFPKALIPFTRAPPLWLNHFLKALPPHTVLSGVRFQHGAMEKNNNAGLLHLTLEAAAVNIGDFLCLRVTFLLGKSPKS